jgi:chromosomal replication initiation ATPase DnaA
MIHARDTRAAMRDGEYIETFNRRVAQVVQECGIARSLLLSYSRKQVHTRPRQLLYALLSKDGVPAGSIGRLVGVDHTSVLHGIRAHEKRASPPKLPCAQPADMQQ